MASPLGRLALAVLLARTVFAASAAYDIGREMETSAFWMSDPDLFVIRHHDAEGFNFTSDARDQADTRRDGAVVWHGLEVYECRVSFGGKGGVERVEIALFNRGGTERIETLNASDGKPVRRLARVDKTISEADFKALVLKVQKLLGASGAKAPRVEKTRLKDTKIRQCVQTWPKTDLGTATALTWNYEKGPKKADPLEPGFVRLAVDGPARTAAAAAKGRLAASRPKARKLSDNVRRETDGDVYVDNVPMVDQGAKGYCAAAATERILRYFGEDVDEHEIAAAAGTSAETGTRTGVMMDTVIALGKRHRFAVRVVAGDANESGGARIGNLVKRVEQYNKAAKRLKKPQISEDVYVRREGNVVSYSFSAAEAAMDLEVRKDMKTNGPGRAKFQSFLKVVRQNVEAGQPLLWGVTLGLYPEREIPQARGGHMRLIIGYNDKKGREGEILYSDSWGKGHELKRMPAEWAWTITDTLLSVRSN